MGGKLLLTGPSKFYIGSVPAISDDKYLGLLVDALALLASDPGRADDRAALLTSELPLQRKRRSFSKAVMVTIFRRDRFTCRYCGSSVVPTPVLRAASLLWPRVQPKLAVGPYAPDLRCPVSHGRSFGTPLQSGGQTRSTISLPLVGTAILRRLTGH